MLVTPRVSESNKEPRREIRGGFVVGWAGCLVLDGLVRSVGLGAQIGAVSKTIAGGGARPVEWVAQNRAGARWWAKSPARAARM